MASYKWSAEAVKWLLNKCKATFATKDLATQSANGLMSASDKTKVDGFGAATEYAKKAEVAAKPIVYQNITVPASAWRSGAGFAGATRTRYADIALAGVTSDLYATVTFNPDDIDNYNLAGICATKDGKITIYTEYAPSVAITIPTIVVGGEADNNLEKPTIIMSATPHNYLDNSNFANPVNQRGKTTYTGNGYTIDRWRTWNDDDSVSVVSGGVTVSGSSLFMYIEPGIVNKNGVYTLAAKSADGTVEVITGTPQAGVWGTMCTLSYDANVNKVWVALQGGHTYVWAALYEGEYTKDTLPTYQPKGYAVELAECLRYFERVNVHDIIDGTPTLYKHIRFTNKRAIPTVSWVMTQSGNLNGDDTANWNITVNDANGVHASLKDKTKMAYWYGYADVSADL